MSDQPSAQSLSGVGQVTAAAAAATIATVALPKGASISDRYKVRVVTFQVGTVDNAHSANLILTHGAVTVGKLLSSSVADISVFDCIEPGTDEDLTVKAVAEFAAASITVAQIIATRMG